MFDFRALLAGHLGTICLVVLVVLTGVAFFYRHVDQRGRHDRNELGCPILEEFRTAGLALVLTNGKVVRSCSISSGCSSDS